MEKMKQNKNNSVILRVASATLAAVYLFLSLSIPSFADSINGQDFTGQPIPYSASTNTNADQWSSGIPVGRNESGTRVWRVISNNQDADIYCFAINNGANFYVVSETNQVYANFVYLNGTSSYGNSRVYINQTNDTYSLYYGGVGSTYVTDSSLVSVPLYSTLDDGLAAVKDIIDNPPGVVEEFNYSISPGYALFIDIHGLSDVQGSLFTNTSAAFASPHTSNQTLSYQTALPGGNVSPQGNGISWQGTGNRDLFGRYKSWNCTLIVQPNKKYIAIYNPVHIDTYVDPEHEDYNGSISVHVNKAYADSSILVPLNTELTGTGTIGTNTTDEEKPMHYDPDSNTWYPTNQDGTPYTPSPYGDYLPSTMNSIHDWLQNIANLIGGFFNGAIGAVTTLVGAGSAFINQLVSLYSWLPAPVYAVLSSALILVITIGVIKVFI